MNEREIFAHAFSLDSAKERAEFLEEACGGDLALQDRIETLLNDQDSLGSFLESPLAGVAPTSSPTGVSEDTGSRVGPYKLLQKIGEGGMGVVYMAEQREPVERRVALKIIRPGMDTEQVIARFEAERQALALMDHQNIARVFDAGATETGRPFFVMELVKGVPITDFCNHNHLTPRERLELFLPVCQAIQHAHQKGIIHRDIKPSNIMVTLYDGRPVPKVIDFGVAKATAQRLTEKTMFTSYGQIVGTLEYMSPEQAEMSAFDVDTRSDIYSLGVVLYELLTGSTPLPAQQLRQATLPEMLRLIREHEPERPSTRLSQSSEALPEISAQRKTKPQRLSALVRGELDWIVLKALDKDRSRRYETADGLGQDLERYLGDEPVEACPPSATYKLRKHLHKHRGLVAAMSAIFACLVVGVVISYVMYHRVKISYSLTERARHQAVRAGKELGETIVARDEALKDKTKAIQQIQQALVDRKAALDRSEASRLVAFSAATLKDDPGLALALAVESAQQDTARTGMQNNVLLAALAQNREVSTLIVGRPGSPLPPRGFNVTSAEFSRNGSRIVTLAHGENMRGYFPDVADSNLRLDVGVAQVWNATGKLLATVIAPPELKFASADVSADGRWLVARFENASLTTHLDSDGSEKACLYSSRVARVWNLDTKRESHVLRGHTDRLTAARFNDDGRRIVTSSVDGSLRIWRTESGELLHVVEPKAHSISNAYFAAPGRIVAEFPGAVWKTTYADQQENDQVDEIDPPFHSQRKIVRAEDGERGRSSQKISLRKLPVPLPSQLPFVDTGRATVRLWDSNTLEEIVWHFETESPTVRLGCVVHNPARAILLSGATVTIHLLDDGAQVAKFDVGLGDIAEVSVSDRGQDLLTIGVSGAMNVHRIEDGSLVRAWAADEWNVRSACFGSSRRHLFVVYDRRSQYEGDSSRGKVVVLDLATGNQVGWLNGHGRHIGTVRRSPSGARVVTASSDGTARVWRADRQPGEATEMPGFGPVQSAIFSPNGRQVLVTSAAPRNHDGWLGPGAIYDVSSGERIAVLTSESTAPDLEAIQHGVGSVTLAQFSTDGKRILTVSDDRHVLKVDPKTTGAKLFNLPNDKWPVAEKTMYSPVRIWDATTGDELFVLKGLSLSVAWAAFSRDGSKIVTLCRRRSSRVVLQIQDGETKVLSTGGGLVHDKSLAQIHVWDGQTGKLLLTLRDLANPHIDLSDDGRTPLALSPDGKWLVITELTGLVDLDSLRRYSLPGIWDGSVPQFSEDGRYLLTHNSRQATALDLENLRSAKGRSHGEIEVCRYDDAGNESRSTIPMADSRLYKRVTVKGHSSPITASCISRDNRRIATASEDRTVRIWDLASGRQEHVLRGHPGPVYGVVFSTDGQYIATRSSDGVVKIFSVETGREFIDLRGHRGAINSVTFSPDSRSILTASDDGTSRLWPVDPLPRASQSKPREMTSDERMLYEVD